MGTWRSLTAAILLALVGTTSGGAAQPASAADSLPLYRVDVVIADAVGTAINEAGDIVGWQTTDGSPRAFVHSRGTLTRLLNPSDRPLSVARDINDAGVIAGYAYKT